MTVAAALASVRHVRSDPARRAKLFERAETLKTRLDEARLPRMHSVSHIVPVHVGEAALCTRGQPPAAGRAFGIYATPINYPTVPRGDERLRLTPTPLHTDCDDGPAGRGAARGAARRTGRPRADGVRRLRRVTEAPAIDRPGLERDRPNRDRPRA